MMEPPFDLSYREYVKASRAAYLRSVLEVANGSVTRAAQLAGVNRTHFIRLLGQHLPERKKRYGGNAAWRALDDRRAQSSLSN